MAAPVPIVVCVAAALFNLGQGVLRPTFPLSLQLVVAASYRMVTLGTVTSMPHPGLLGLWSLAIGGVGGFVAPFRPRSLATRRRRHCRVWPSAGCAR